jgi:hypothetical protein
VRGPTTAQRVCVVQADQRLVAEGHCMYRIADEGTRPEFAWSKLQFFAPGKLEGVN